MAERVEFVCMYVCMNGVYACTLVYICCDVVTHVTVRALMRWRRDLLNLNSFTTRNTLIKRTSAIPAQCVCVCVCVCVCLCVCVCAFVCVYRF